ncbi:hypothetical protein SCA6_018838 [Theobroma cacao]
MTMGAARGAFLWYIKAEFKPAGDREFEFKKKKKKEKKQKDQQKEPRRSSWAKTQPAGYEEKQQSIGKLVGDIPHMEEVLPPHQVLNLL